MNAVLLWLRVMVTLIADFFFNIVILNRLSNKNELEPNNIPQML